jgi:hypothetical protein
MKSNKIVDKERIIELMIAKNHIFDPEREEDQPYISKILQVNPAIKKHQVFQPFSCHPFKTSPGKSHFFSHLSLFISSTWVGHP